MHPEQFSQRAERLFTEARNKLPEISLAPLNITDVAAATAAKGITMKLARYQRRDVYALQRDGACIYLPREDEAGEKIRAWPVHTYAGLNCKGTAVVLKPMFHLCLVIPSEAGESGEECLRLFEDVLDGLSKKYQRVLDERQVSLAEPLTQEHCARGPCWFCDSELN